MCASDRRIILKQAKKIAELETKLARYEETPESESGGRLDTDKVLDRMIDGEEQLYDMTGLEREEFEWILHRFEKTVQNSPDAPRFSEYANEPGNTCIISVRRVLFIALCRKRNNPKQAVLAALADVDQSTVSRYLTLADGLLVQILPTAENVAAAIRRERTADAFKKFVPGRGGGELYLDATFAQVQRPQENQSEAYSGKRKRHVYNVQITSSKAGLVLDIGGPEEGSAHDMEVLRRNPPNFGKWTRAMKNADTLPEKRIVLYTDKGYRSVEKDYPGIVSKQPHKKPKGAELTESEERYNKRISRRRIRVEHAINRLKCYRRMSSVYDGTREEFYTEIQVVSGLTNLHIMLKDRKYVKSMERACPQIK